MYQFPGQGKPAQGILFDSDFGTTIDSVLSLALLHGLEGKREARIASLTINRPGLKAAQFCDAVEKFYASATTGPAAQFFVASPIGLISDANTAVPYSSLLTKYPPRLTAVNDTADPATLMRNTLTAQYDHSAVVVLAGPATNLLALLSLKGGPELIAQKVKLLSIAEYNVNPDPRLLAQWPTPIVIARKEVGDQVRFPASSIDKDFAYNPNHPVADAYRAYHTMPYDAPTNALAAALYGARPNEGYFKLSEPTKNVRYLIPDPAQSEKLLAAYTELASAKPVPRATRRPVVVDQQQ
jgi:purine nucleosidase